MSQERVFSLGNPWFRASVGITVAVGVFSAFVGFIWLPSVEPDAQFQGIWNAICSAAGVPRTWLKSEPSAAAPTFVASTVVVTPQMLDDATAESIGRGATLALKCTMCHGARGLSEANSPNLAGQYAASVYKELQDFKTGARTNAIMSPMIANLSDRDMRDLAAYYAYLPRPPAYHPAGGSTAPSIVAHGAPMRNIPPCAACHGGMDTKTGSPWLDGESAVYLKAQLQAFASGDRHNDISEQMRNVARRMTPAEIDAAAEYYASQPQ
ncbi:cytochrome c [Aliidongia dinghuensis]|uniref:Cytochrome c n=1 Tax=Aliidongia dinghuensis TaxID=1867774 RepID=A0A8J2YVG5_9PROT|nr:c-type cytochrome [Aliidongia dinghuensis]GGF20601.1 cytochrome c [Aliidongia dinghuensis]